VTLGVWRGTDDFLAGRRFTRFEPGTDGGERRRRLAEWERAVSAALAWARNSVSP
jgi:glycerol kinase